MLSPVLVEHVGGDVEDDVLRRDLGGTAQSRHCGFWMPRPWNTQGPGQGTEGSNEAEGIVNLNGKLLPVNSSATSKARDLFTSGSALSE